MFRTDFFQVRSVQIWDSKMARKHDPAFVKLLLEHVKVTKNGKLTFHNLYVNLVVNIGWKGKIIVVPYSHLVWLLTFGRWPKEGFVLDHINDVPTDNRPINLQEVTETENQRKRRGRRI